MIVGLFKILSKHSNDEDNSELDALLEEAARIMRDPASVLAEDTVLA